MLDSMKNKWDYSGASQMCFADVKQESYKKAAEFLGDSIEDWGGGTGWAKKYFINYKNIDGSFHKNVDIHADLREYTSDCDNILMRQVLECNPDWKKILDNVKKSFKKKFCLVIYTPFAEKTHIVSSHIPTKADNTKMSNDMILYEIYFNKQDILDCFLESEFIVKEETIKTDQGYKQDWILYVERIQKTE